MDDVISAGRRDGDWRNDRRGLDREWSRDRNADDSWRRQREDSSWYFDRTARRGDFDRRWEGGDWADGGWKNYGQYRSAQVHARNAARKEAKQLQRLWNWDFWSRYDYPRYTDSYYVNYGSYVPWYTVQYTTYARPYYGYVDPYYASGYSDPGYNYNSLYDNGYLNVGLYSGYDPYSYSGYYDPYVASYSGYYDPYSPWYANGYSNTYYPGYAEPYFAYYDRPSWKEVLLSTLVNAVLGNGYGRSYDDYAYYDEPGYAYDDGYYYSQPYYSISYGYPDYSYDDGYGYLPQYDQYSTGYVIGMPFSYATDYYSGYEGSMIRQAFNSGYEQGYLAGQAARDYEDAAFYDPYAYDDVYDDGYSYSVAETRRYCGEGYELGYQDGLNARDDYYRNSVAHVDLVGLLVTGSLGV